VRVSPWCHVAVRATPGRPQPGDFPRPNPAPPPPAAHPFNSCSLTHSPLPLSCSNGHSDQAYTLTSPLAAALCDASQSNAERVRIRSEYRKLDEDFASEAVPKPEHLDLVRVCMLLCPSCHTHSNPSRLIPNDTRKTRLPSPSCVHSPHPVVTAVIQLRHQDSWVAKIPS
jgi:hypothetical protein